MSEAVMASSPASIIALTRLLYSWHELHWIESKALIVASSVDGLCPLVRGAILNDCKLSIAIARSFCPITAGDSNASKFTALMELSTARAPSKYLPSQPVLVDSSGEAVCQMVIDS